MKENLRELFKDLSKIVGVSGSEQEVARYMKKEFEKVADEVKVDPCGNVIAIKRGSKPGPKVMLAAHMDEIGFCVKNIFADGFIAIDKVGSASNKVMEGRKVWVKDSIPGVIGIKPGHLQTPEDATKAITPKQAYVDVGASSKQEVIDLGIEIGDQIVLQSSYMEMANKDIICTRAVDDRINCAILIELLRQLQDVAFAGTLYAVATVQEETGMKGAFMAGNLIEPDYAIVVDTVPAGDTPEVDTDRELPVYLGNGPVCSVADGVLYGILFTFIHPKVREIVKEQAEKAGESIQFISLVGESYATDAARLGMAGKGIPLATLAVPRRYSHSPVEMFNINDAVSSLRILKSIVETNGYKDLSFI